jgi:transcriptional regulator with XRE-family HTH domain
MVRRPAASGSTSSLAMLFGAEVRHAREAMAYSQAELAKLLHCDRSLVTRIECGERVPQKHFAINCDKVLHTDGLLLRIWSRVDWYADVEHPDWFQRFVTMEAAATALRKFQVQLIPGLLQTEDYARALFARGAAAGNGALIEERVAARMSRQRRFLCGENAPLLIVLMDESVIRSNVGGAAIMRGQLKHLLAVAKRPNIALQVVPFDRYDLARPNTSMTLVTLPDNHKFAYSESLDRGHFTDDPVVIARHTRIHDLLRAEALSASESTALINGAMEGYDHDQVHNQRGGVGKKQLQRGQRRRLHRGGPRIVRNRSRSGQ